MVRLAIAFSAGLVMVAATLGCQRSASPSTTPSVEQGHEVQESTLQPPAATDAVPVAYVQHFNDQGRGYAVMVASRPATEADTMSFGGDEPRIRPETMLARIVVYFNGKCFDVPQPLLRTRFDVYPGAELTRGNLVVIESEDRKHLGIGIGGADGEYSWGSTWVVDGDGKVTDKIRWANDEPIEDLVRRHLAESEKAE